MKTEKDVDKFEKTHVQLAKLYDEICGLSKKSPNDAVNPFKLRFTNQVLKLANEILGSEFRPFVDFEDFKEDELPTNSDVTLILSQYLEIMERFRVKCIQHDSLGYWYWVINGKESLRRTSPPKERQR